jgi:hypothetical protein
MMNDRQRMTYKLMHSIDGEVRTIEIKMSDYTQYYHSITRYFHPITSHHLCVDSPRRAVMPDDSETSLVMKR